MNNKRNVLVQQIVDYILNDSADSWQLGNSTIFFIHNNYFQHCNFDGGDIHSMLAHCSDQDLEEFAIDNLETA